MEVSLLLSSLIKIEDSVVNNVLLSALDFRAKIQASMAIGFSKKPDDAWFDELQQELNEIDNDLRPERNRMIHDYWLQLPEKVIRMQHIAKVIKDQRSKVLTLANNKPITVGEIIALTVRIAKASGKMTELRNRYSGSAPLPKIPSSPPRQKNPDQG